MNELYKIAGYSKDLVTYVQRTLSALFSFGCGPCVLGLRKAGERAFSQ
jgi:hypothetical protein